MFRQDLFFKNLPTSGIKELSTNLGFMSSLNKNDRLLANNSNVCFIWTGTGRIKKLEKEYPNKIKNKLKKKTIEIYLYEPMCLLVDGKYNCLFYSEFNSKIVYDNIASAELESIQIFKEKNNLTNIKVFTADYNLEYLKKLYPDLQLFCLDLFLRHATNRIPKSSLPNKVLKRFWCGNWRYTVHRHLIMAYLIHTEGNYSWNVQCDFENLKQNYWFNLKKYQSQDIERFNLIKDGTNLLNLKTSRIDTNINAVSVENPHNVYVPGDRSPSFSKKFLDSYKECFCAVVNETRYAQPFANFSEKTTIAIASKLPLIMVAPPKTLEYLRTFGFKTFDRWWDESYDLEEDHEKRLIKIFNVIDFIKNKSLTELDQIYKEMSEILEHNASLLKSIPYNFNAL
jgi:hypothetical protein